MLVYLIKRFGQMLLVLFLVSILVFLMIHLIPGDPVLNFLGMEADEATVEALRNKLGLNDSMLTQYGNFLKDILRGDLGTSIYWNEPVTSLLAERLPVTIKLAIGGTLIASLLGILAGIISAVNQNKFWDNVLMVLSLLSVSTPSFFLAMLLMLLFALKLGWLPSIGLLSAKHYVLPMITMGLSSLGLITRTTRSAMLDVLHEDYIRTSRSRGLRSSVIIFSHALRNALIPVLTAVGLRFGGLLAGSMLIESVFSIPGIGRLLIDGVLRRDYPVVRSTVLVIAATFIVLNTLIDILYALVDPRVRAHGFIK